MRAIPVVLLALGALALSACATPRASRGELAVVFAESDGKVGTLIVTHDGERTVLNRANAAVRIGGSTGSNAGTLSPAEAQHLFGAALAALPERPLHFMVHFEEGSDQPTAASRDALDRIAASIGARRDADVVIVGHTDLVGSDRFNDALSMQRAERVRTELLARGVRPERLQASARGMREPLLPTPAGISEPRNRRAEITVR